MPVSVTAFGWGLFAFVAGDLLCLFAVETEFNAGLESPWCVAMLCLAAAAALVGKFHRQIAEILGTLSILRLSLLLAIWGGAICIAAPYAMLVNALIAPGTTVLLEGPVAEKSISTLGKRHGYLLTFFDARTHDQARVLVSEARYNAIKVGTTYSRCMYEGRFGVPFLWRYSEKEPVCLPDR